jgi:hypothetical protein
LLMPSTISRSPRPGTSWTNGSSAGEAHP